MKKIVLLFFILIAWLMPDYSFAQATKARFNHIGIYVVNLQTSAAFYRNIIGLDTIPEPFHDGKHAWFSIGTGLALHVIQGAAHITEHEKNAHTCFSVTSVEAFIPLLTANHITYESADGKKNTITNRVDGVKQIYFEDPDGYWIEINDAREK